MTSTDALSSAHKRRLTRLAYACMLVQGVNAGWLGPFLPTISNKLQVTIDRSGLAVSAVAAGYLTALLAGGEIAQRWTAQRLLAAAMVFVSGGLLGIAIAPHLPLLLAAAFVVGLGQGAIDIAGNTLVASLNRDRLGAALNYLHMMFGVGALLGPIIVGFALAGSISYSMTFAAGAAVAALLASMVWDSRAADVRAAAPETASAGALSFLAHPVIWIIGSILFLYVGGETGIGTWLFSYLRLTSPLPATIASWAVSLFWLGLILGRMFGGSLAHRASPKAASILAGVASAAGLSALIFAPRNHGPFTAVTIVLIGIGFGPTFPNMIAIAATKFPADVGRVTSAVAVGGALGAVVMPWAMGVALARQGPFHSMGLALGAAGLMIVLLLILDPDSRP